MLCLYFLNYFIYCINFYIFRNIFFTFQFTKSPVTVNNVHSWIFRCLYIYIHITDIKYLFFSNSCLFWNFINSVRRRLSRMFFIRSPYYINKFPFRFFLTVSNASSWSLFVTIPASILFSSRKSSNLSIPSYNFTL